MRPLLSLVMIVKDEAASLKAVLEAALPFCDHATILDTGSTDGTQEIARSFEKVTLHEGPFVDFSDARNRVLDLEAAREDAAIFSLMLSGDEFLKEGAALREHLEQHRTSDVDCHLVRVTIDDTSLFSPRVLRTGSAWSYEGVVHEVPCNRKEKDAPIGTVPGAMIEHVVSDPERRLSNIWEKHIPLLRAQLEKDPYDERALIFLAQSYEALMPGFDSGERVAYSREAVALYYRRLAIPTGNEVERNYVKMHLVDDARLTGDFTDAQLYAMAEELRKNDPHRPEVALLCVETGMKVVPLERLYEMACRAAVVAAEAVDITNSSPVSMTCGWRAHYFAAIAARQLAKAFPTRDLGNGLTYAKLVGDHVEAGLKAGGPWPMFKAIVAAAVPQDASA